MTLKEQNALSIVTKFENINAHVKPSNDLIVCKNNSVSSEYYEIYFLSYESIFTQYKIIGWYLHATRDIARHYLSIWSKDLFHFHKIVTHTILITFISL